MDFNYLAIRRSGPFAFLMRYFMKFPVEVDGWAVFNTRWPRSSCQGPSQPLGLPQVPSAIRERRRTLRYRNLLVRQMVQTVWLKQGNRQSRLGRCYAAASNG